MRLARHSLARHSLGIAIAIMVVWGINFSVTKFLLDHISVGPFLFMRFTLMPVLGFALLAAVYRRHIAKSWPRREDLARFAIAGLIGHSLHIGVVMWGINLSTAFSSSLVLTSGPLWTLLILAFLGVTLRRRQLVGTLVAFAGILVFMSDKFVRGFASGGWGDLMLLFAASLFALYTVIVRPLTDKYGPVAVLSYTLLFGAPPLVAISLPSFLATDLSALSAGVWAAFFYSVVVSSFLGWLGWTWINAVRGVARSAPLQYLMPPIAGLVAWLTLGEAFPPLKILGAAVVMVGVAWAQFGAGPPRKEVAQPDAG